MSKHNIHFVLHNFEWCYWNSTGYLKFFSFYSVAVVMYIAIQMPRQILNLST